MIEFINNLIEKIKGYGNKALALCINSDEIKKKVRLIGIKIFLLFYKVKALCFKKKVFGIGLSRTGTKSLTYALSELGYKSYHYPPLRTLYKYTDKYDALTDITISLNYKILDKKYPNSKFILTIREINSWLDSCEQHRKNINVSARWKDYVREKIYGTSGWDRTLYERAYNKHLDDVLKYFENRPDDLLVLNIVGGEQYVKLCQFLKKPVLKNEFPHKNVGNKI